MSTVMLAPERPPVALNEGNFSGQEPPVHFLSSQVVCVLVLALTDLSALPLPLSLLSLSGSISSLS